MSSPVEEAQVKCFLHFFFRNYFFSWCSSHLLAHLLSLLSWMCLNFLTSKCRSTTDVFFPHTHSSVISSSPMAYLYVSDSQIYTVSPNSELNTSIPSCLRYVRHLELTMSSTPNPITSSVLCTAPNNA